MRLAAFLLLSTLCFGQSYANLPGVEGVSSSAGLDLQTTASTASPAVIPSGHVVVGCVGQHDGTGTCPSITVQDNCSGTTYTSSSVVRGGASNNLCTQMWWGTMASTCASAPIFSTSPNISANNSELVFKDIGANLTADGSMQSSVSSSTPSSMSLSLTTADNTDVVAACDTGDQGTIVTGAAQGPSQAVASDSGQIETVMSITDCGAAGSCSVTHLTGVNQYNNFLGWAFKPTNHVIATTNLADGAVNVAYQFPLQEVGGTSAPTWSNTAGTWPTGCSAASINSSTGVISCTPTQSGTFNLTFSDGTASQAFTWKVRSSFGVPTVISSSTGGIDENWSVGGVSNGSVLLLMIQGFLSSSRNSYQESTSDLTDTCGSTWKKFQMCGGMNAPGTLYVAQAPTSCGTDTITFAKTGVGSPVGSAAFVINNAQPWIDLPACGVNVGSGSISVTTPSYTPQVPNELLLCYAGTRSDNVTNWTCNSPFTARASSSTGIVQTQQVYATYYPPTQSALTATAQLTSTGTNNQIFSTLIGIRPGAPIVQSFLGEKRRRVVY